MGAASWIAAPVLLLLITATVAWVFLVPRVRSSRNAARDREHARLTEWFAEIRPPGGGPAVARDADGRVILPLNRGTGGRHRADRG